VFKNYNYQNYILAFLWLSPVIKAFVSVYFLSINWTGLAMLIATLDIIYNIFTKRIVLTRNSQELLFLYLIIFLWILISLLYSPSSSYKYVKTINFIPNLIFLLYPLVVKEINIKKIIQLYIIIIIPVSLFFIYMRSVMWHLNSPIIEAFLDIRNAYLVLGLQIGILFLMLYYYRHHKLLQVIVIVLLFASSARGSLLFTLVTATLIFVLRLINIKRIYLTLNKKKIIVKSILALSILSIILYFSDSILPLFESSIKRFSRLASGFDDSSARRIEMMNFAITQPFSNLFNSIFGNGFGSFGVLYENADKRLYPHNLILEAFFELGIIGVLLFISLILAIVKNFFYKKSIFIFLFILVLLNAMKSNTITDLWMFFSFAGGLSISQEKVIFNRRIYSQ